jgi:hypothetical protein
MQLPRRKLRHRVRIPGAVIKTLVSTVVLLVLLVGGGVAYTWYSGKNGPDVQPEEPEPVATSQSPFSKPPKVSPKARVGLSIQFLTSPVRPGENASINVKTNPLADCEITVEYDEKKSKDSGLKPKAADEYGIVDWTWTVDETAPKGKWPVEVTCANKKNWGKVIGDLVVKEVQ